MIADCSHRMMLTRALAVFVVVLLLSSSLVTLLMYESEALEDYQHTVVYHSNFPGEGSESVTVIYDGIASAEYNPEFGIGENGTVWKDTEGGIVTANVTISVSFEYRGDRQETFTVGLSNLPDGYTIDSVSCTGDFESWSQTEDSLIISSDRGWLSWNHRGTVEMKVSFPYDYEHKVFGGWSTSKDGNVDYLPGDIIPDDVRELYAVWIVPTLTTAASTLHSSRETSYSIPALETVQEIPYSQRDNYNTTLYDSGTALGRIYVIDGYETAPSSLPSGTYRTQNDAVMQINGNVSIDGDVIIDNLRLSSSSGENHGDGDNGLFANGHMLILGPGVSSSGGSSPTSYLQVYGGHWRNAVTPDGGSTDVRIFAGTFYNVVAGSRGSTIDGDTHLVMRGGTVLDTVIGGNSGNSGDSNANSTNRITGSTHVYMLGDVIMPGDYYEEDALGNSSMFDGLPQISESTILTGGSNNGYIGGGTNVFISNNAQLWDVQAGGRRGNSTVEGTAMAEVSGNAVVKHVLCGSITDGMDGKNASPGNDKACVGATDIRVTDGAKVGSVFGAGYDTYYPATYASMVGQDTTISITIDGSSVVGYVYGGGYRGYSAMDTSVYVGVPATEASGSDPLSVMLRIGSIYGGSSVGESSNYQSDAELLIGDTMVRVGNLDPDTRGSAYTDFSITGDVFGEGDYCAITGESSVTFTAFEQGGSMLSVQKADTLDVIGSSLVLDGNVDGSDTQASERLSLNLIGDLRLQRLDGHVSSLDMKAVASQIGGYGSLDESGDPIVYSDTETALNRITLRDGMMMSILGEGNNGLSADMNEIRGFTILDNGGDSYYGTFAMGPTDLVQNGLTGFMIETDDGLVAAQEGHYTFYYSDGTGSTQPVSMTMWFIAGVYKVETTMVLQDVTGEDVISAEDDVMAPKTVSNSTISFVGGYVNADSQGSLNLVGSTDENPGTDFQVLVGGTRDANHIYFNEGDGVVAFPDSSVRFDGSGIYLNVKVSTKSGFDTTGYAGTVTLHMVEYIGDIPINMFDVEVSIYLRVTSDIPTITETIVMRASGSRKYGTTDVYLPVLGANHMAEYTIKLLGAEGETEGVFVDIEGTLTLETVATNLNKNGWQSTEHSGEIEPVRGQDTVLGVGGVFAPVIRFDYTADEPFQEIHLELTIQDESGGTPKVYTIIMQPEPAEYVELSFYDKYLMYDEGSDSISWSQWAQGADGGYLDPVFVLQLQFGMRLDTIKIAVSESFLGGTIGGTAIEGLDTKGYIDMVREAISEASSTEGWYGDVLLLQSDMDPGSPVSTVLCGDESYVEERLVDLGIRDEYRVMGVEEFLDEYVSMKPGTDYRDGSSDETFEYSRHYNWYDTHE